MNFFANQAKAKTNTARLVALFSLAVLSLIIITHLFIVFVFCWSQNIPVFDTHSFLEAIDLLGPELLWSVALVIAGIVLLAYFYKAKQLSGGGKSVAEALHGRLINSNTRDPDERKILNVVEEMAIASGTTVPPVYVIDDHAINAFAAGFTPRDAIIGITRGCIRVMSREELQGIIAHEFSHIFNGDMRLNIRLISMLHGILVIGLIGGFILRSLSNRRHGYSSSRSSKNGGGIAMLMVLGAGLYTIGYTGTFFGKLIKAAVSRQREYLADASAVQFTRNPGGISGALKKIGGYLFGSRMQTPQANEFSHLFFGEAIGKSFSSLMATHPDLETRIRRIEPRWNGTYPTVPMPDEVKRNPAIIKPTNEGVMIDRVAAAAAGLSIQAFPLTTTLMDSIGEPTAEHLTEAQHIIAAIPENLMQAAHEPSSARALLYCLLLDKNRPTIREKQLAVLEQKASPETFKEVLALKDSVALLDIRHRLPLLDLCMPALKQLSDNQYIAFKNKMLALMKADNTIDLFEWSLYRITVQHLEKPVRGAAQRTLPQVQEDCRRLISAVALQACLDKTEAAKQFLRGWNTLKLGHATLLENALDDMPLLDLSLKRANTLHPLKKPLLIKACAAVINNKDQPESLELIRAISDGLDVPMPPQLAGQAFS